MHANDPREDLERLMRDAAEGVTVAGRPPTWEAGRPGLLPSGQPVKHRGFIDYSRCGTNCLILLSLILFSCAPGS